jgi:hypothetical protein
VPVGSAVHAHRPKIAIKSGILALFRKIEKISIENPLSYGKY